MRWSLLFRMCIAVFCGILATAISVAASALALPFGCYDANLLPYFQEDGVVYATDSAPTIGVSIYRAWGAKRIEFSYLRNFHPQLATEELSVGLEHLPNWSRHESPFRNERGDIVRHSSLMSRWIDARGWPFLAAYAIVDYDKEVLVHGGWVAYDEAASRPHVAFSSGPPIEPRFIPMYPIASGLVMNLLFYSTITYRVMVLWPTRLRRAWRRRHQRCIKCGYSLRGLADPRCPECGHGS